VYAHWSSPVLWYASIILSLTSIVLGAQQALAIPKVQAGCASSINSEPRISKDCALDFQRRLKRRDDVKNGQRGRSGAVGDGQPKW